MKEATKLKVLSLLPALIVGKGRSGIAAADLLETLGFSHKKDFFFYSDNELESDFLKPPTPKERAFASLIISPGYPIDKDWIHKYLKVRTLFTNELNLASAVFEEEKIMAVTGSIGKSTCVSQIAFALEQAGVQSFLGGNIGKPLSCYALDVLQKKPRAEVIILELSSYQLELLTMRPDLAAITNFVANHLDRYPSKEDYYRTKWRLVELCRGKVLINASNTDLRDWAKENPNLNLQLQSANKDQDPVSLLSFEACKHLGLNKEQATNVFQFKGLPHRFEIIENSRLLAINDSKCTTMEGVVYATNRLLKIPRKKPGFTLLVGGKDKAHNWEDLRPLSSVKGIKIITFGESAPKIMRVFSKAIMFDSLKATLNSSYPFEEDGALLLSPGGASQDEFSDFEERGNYIKGFVLRNFHD